MNYQIKQFLRLISQQGGEVLSHDLAAAALELIKNEQRLTEAPPAAEAAIPMMLLLMIKDAGGSVTFPVERLDNEPKGFLVKMGASEDGKEITCFTVPK